MSTITIFVTGDEIGTYSGRSMSGNSNGVKLQLFDVEPLGDATDVFRIEIRQINNGQDTFSNGQIVNIFAEPDTDPPSPPLFSNLNPQHDQFQGRASSGEHQVFTNQNIVLDINGLTAGTVQYGPGLEPLRSEQLPFSAFSSSPPDFPCYLAGTLIETDIGPLPIEVLREGDLVKTQDHGMQPLLWVGKSKIDGSGAHAPINIPAGALGNYRDLLVSPQHRMLQHSWEAEMMFGCAEHFVPAHALVGSRGISVAPRKNATYCHLLCQNHEIIFAEGIPAESLHLGHVTKDILGSRLLDDIRTKHPSLRLDLPTARPCLKVWETRAVSRGYSNATNLRSSAA